MATRTTRKNRTASSNSVVEAKTQGAGRSRNGAASALNNTRNDLPARTRAAMATLLNARLADLMDLYSQVKQAHWNIKGPGFHAIHELLDELADLVEGFADEVAERAVQLGGIARGTVRMAAAASSLPEYPEELQAQRPTLETIADRLAAVGASVRAGIDESDDAGDKDTADLFTDVSRGIDKYLWFIESHLHPEE